jgi:hypothetical protein
MGRNRSTPIRSIRFVVALAAWMGAASLAQGLFGVDVGHAGPVLEQQLKRKGTPPQPQPQRSHEEDSYEPWELVRV